MEFLNQPGNVTDEHIKHTLNNRYQILSPLGQGGNAITYVAKDSQTNQQVAIKILSLNRLDNWKKIELFEREAKILQQLNHPAIPQYLDYFQIETDNERAFCLVQQLAPGKSLATLIEAGWQPEYETIQQITHQILEVLIYLQELTPPIIHRDIKPENIILNGQNSSSEKVDLFLVDFGAVQDTYHHTVLGSTVVGTHGYMAPEQFRGQAFLATDLYGLGTTLLFLLTRKSPLDLPQRQLKFNFRPLVKTFPTEFTNWIDKLIEPNYEDRFHNAEAALAVLQNPELINDYLNLKPRRPADTSIRLTKTEDELNITIPPALFRKRCDRLLFSYLVIWYVFLLFIAASSIYLHFIYSYSNLDIELGVLLNNIFSSLYITNTILEIFSRSIALTNKTPRKTILIIKLFSKISFIGVILGTIFLVSALFGSILNPLVIMILGIDFIFLEEARILLTRDLLFTTNLIISQDGLIETKHNKFIPGKKIDFDTSKLSHDFLINQFIKNKLGGLLTKAEKSWVVEEIDKWLRTDK